MKLGHLALSLRRSIRMAGRHPGFSVAVVVAVGLSVGATGGVLAIVKTAFFSPLAYEDPEQLVFMTETSDGDRISTSYLNYLDWRAGLGSFDGLSMFVQENVTLTGEGPAQRLAGVAVSSDLFETVGVYPSLGRGFEPSADLEGGVREVVLGHDVWRTTFGEDPSVIGRTIVIDQAPLTVVGVTPPGFAFPRGIVFGAAELYLPIGQMVSEWNDRSSHPGIYAVGRLADGVTVEAARDEATQLVRVLAQQHPENENEGVYVAEILDEMLGTLPNALLLMSASAGLLLLIGFGNAGGLFLSRMVTGASEKGVARALGADRRDVITELTVEGAVLGSGAALVALGVAALLLRLFNEDLAGWAQLEGLAMGGPVIFLTAGTAVAGTVLMCVLPWTGAFLRTPIQLGSSKHGFSLSRSRKRIQKWLVGGQAGLTVLLLAVSAVLVRSFGEMARNDGGIRPAQVVAMRTSLPESEYEGPPTLDFYRQLTERIEALPGVEAVGGISTLPFTGAGSQSRTRPDDFELEEGIRTDVNVVLGDYFQAMGVDLLEGRAFGPEDGPDAPPVVVVDQRLADRFWPGQSPIGKTISGWGLESATVVGLARHVKNYGVIRESRQELYMPHGQRSYLTMYLLVRSTHDSESLVGSIRNEAMLLDADIPVVGAWPMVDIVEGTVATPRLAARLGSVMSLLAGALAFLGAYALIAHSVAQRTRELGLRMALGARRRELALMVLKQGISVGSMGAVAGLMGAFAGATLLEGFVYGVAPRDPVSFLAAAGAVLMLIALAAYLPARRASRIEPTVALRAGS